MWRLPSNYNKLLRIRIDTTTTPFAIESNLPQGCIPISQIEHHDNYIDYLEPRQELRSLYREAEEHQEPTQCDQSATFHDFIQTLPAVERVLLEQCYEVHPDGPSLIEIFTDAELLADLILVTDGGAAHNHGSFGWVIGTQDTELWKCKRSSSWTTDTFIPCRISRSTLDNVVHRQILRILRNSKDQGQTDIMARDRQSKLPRQDQRFK